MTTITVRGRVMAADSRITRKEYIETDTEQKIFRLSDGSLIANSGDHINGLILIDKVRAAIKSSKKTGKKMLPNVVAKGVRALLLSSKNKDIWLYEHGGWVRVTDGYYAIGSGGDHAMAAMDAGADARLACKIGMKRDVYSGGRCRSKEV